MQGLISMEIDFVASNQNASAGSYRIWIRDAVPVLESLGCNVRIVSNQQEARDNSVLIFSKGDYRNYRKEANRRVGAINPSLTDDLSAFDFLIAGSIEEKSSLTSKCPNVFIVNLIEAMYRDSILKKHEKKNGLIVGFHGSSSHLGKLALLDFFDVMTVRASQGKDDKFVTVTENPEFCRNILGNARLNHEHHRWTISDAKQNIAEFDVGIVPNLTDVSKLSPDFLSYQSTEFGLYNSDYIYRFKNKSNAGRCFVLIQLGIPVIADLTPSNLPLLFDEKCGSIFSSKLDLRRALERFDCEKERTDVAKKAHARFADLYEVKSDWSHLLKWLTK